MSWEGILKYPPPLLLSLEGPKIHLHDRLLPITWQIINLLKFWQNYILPWFSVTRCFFSAFSSENVISVIWVEFWVISMLFFFQNFGKILVYWLLAILQRGWVRKMKLSEMGLKAKVCHGKVFWSTHLYSICL